MEPLEISSFSMVDFDDGWNMIDFDDGLMGFSQPSMLHNPTPLPPGLPTPEEIDALIAQEMTRMSLKEREKALHDVHGIGEVNDEDPAFIRSCLFELEEHLVTIKHDTSYALAEVLSRKYVHDKKLRMMFLRADEYETKQAAERMIRFFELKNKLFGVNKLVKDITLDDLGVDDMETLQSGCVQVSTSRDAAGRPIVVLLPKLRRFKQAENAGRGAYYVFMSTVESASNQKVGISLVCYNLDHKDTRSVNSELRNSLPVRFASLHLCINDEKEYQLALGALKALHSKSLVRYRSHFGTHEEVQHELASFGIHKNAVPVTENGHMIMVHHETWLNLRRKIEQIQAPRMAETNTKMAANFTPRPDDVLFGRGKLVGEHPGNTQFRQMVDFYTDKYESSGKVEKTCIAEIIVRAVKDSSACFLKKDEDGLWEEVDDAMARRKVAHAFRNRRMISRATQESSSKISSAVDYELQSKEVRMKNKNEKRRKK